MRTYRIILLLFLAFLHKGISTADAKTKEVRPDWISHKIPLEDTRRHRLFKKNPEKCLLQVIEIPYSSPLPQRGTVLMIPGLMQNALALDLAPEVNISYARYVMQNYGLQPFLLNTRGNGQSCLPKNSNLDDIAIEDVSIAVNFVSEMADSKIFVMGHSQGGLVLQAYMAGMARCEGTQTCFQKNVAEERQSHLLGAVILGANVGMTGNPKGKLRRNSMLAEFLLGRPFSIIVDEIPMKLLTRLISPSKKRLLGVVSGSNSFAYNPFWHSIYQIPNVSLEMRQKFYDSTLDTTSLGVLLQYARGIRQLGMSTRTGDRYADALPNIHVPVAMGVFEYDPFATPEATLTETFNKLGSPQKHYVMFNEEGHEDFLLNSNLFAKHNLLWNYLLLQ